MVRAAFGSIVVQFAGVAVVGLRGKNIGLEVDDLLHLLGRRGLPLSVSGGGIDGLVSQIVIDRLECAVGILKGFASVPHDGAEKRNVGGRQRATISRNRRGAIAAVRVVAIENGELRIGRDLLFDADETLAQEQTVGVAPGVLGGNILGGATGAVVGPEDRIGAASGVEPRLNMRRGHGPSVAGLVTSDAPPSVRSQVLEKGVVFRIGRAAGVEVSKTPFGIRELLKTGDELV